MLKPRGLAHAAALQLAEMNLFSFPCHDKTPVVANWTEGRPNRPLVDSYFKNRPDANLGLRTGNGIFAIDLDAKHDGEAVWADFLRKRKLPLTANALTPGGGRHLLFGAPARCVIRNSSWWLGMPGVDVRGHHGYIVVEPSIIVVGQEEERRERQYVWLRTPQMGIAKAPAWLLDMLVDRELERAKPKPLGPARPGDLGPLVADLIARFPITGHGQRNGQFAKVVPSALGRGFDAETVISSVKAWWQFHHERGLCTTPPSEAAIVRYIDQLKVSPTFGAARGIDHDAACRRISLPESVGQAIAESGKGSPTLFVSIDSMGVTSPLDGPLCRTPHEVAFVEGLLVQALHEISSGKAGPIKFTRDQIRAIVADRHPDITWGQEQFERLKRKYIDREGKPASRASLLRQVETGNRAYASKGANPSSYEPTGLLALLELCGAATACSAG